MDYTVLTAGDLPVGGMTAIGNGGPVPADVPPHWNVYFAVDDVDATVARVEKLGGTTLVPPCNISGGGGRFAVVADPQGAPFTVKG